MITAAMIKEKAKELGAGVCGIGDIKYFIGDDPQHNPLSILPNATFIICCLKSGPQSMSMRVCPLSIIKEHLNLLSLGL